MSEGKQPQWSNLVRYAPKGILALRCDIDSGEDLGEPGDCFDKGNKGGWRLRCNNYKECVISQTWSLQGAETEA